MAHGFRHAIAGDHVRHTVSDAPAIGKEIRILHHLADALAQAADAPHLLGFVGLEMAIEDALLGMPDPTGLGHRNDLEARVDIEVPSGAIIMLEERGHGLVPAAQDALLAGVGRIEIDAALGASDLGSADGEFDLHRLGEGDHLIAIEALPHAGATAGRAAAQAVDDDPSPGLRFGIRPFEDDFRGAGAVLVEKLLHDRIVSLGHQGVAKVPKSTPPQTSSDAPVTVASEVGFPCAVRSASQAKAMASLPSTQSGDGTSNAHPLGSRVRNRSKR